MGSITPADIASWPMPNYVDPETRVNLIYGVEIPLTVVMTLFVAARLVGRRKLNAFGLDDWTMLLAWATGASLSIVNCVATKYGTGYHIWDCKIAWIPPTGKFALTTQLLFAPCVGITKISLCLSYLRIFPSQSNRWFCFSAITWLTAWTIATFFAFLFQCWPIKDNWDVLNFSHQNCINKKIFFIVTAATNSLTDILVFLWPARYLWNIQIPRKQRAGLIVSFGLGCLVCVAGACRIWYLEIYFRSYDITWEGAVIYVITALETNLGIVCGSLPGVKPLLAQFFPRIFASTKSGASLSSQQQSKRSIGKSLSQSFSKSLHFHSLSEEPALQSQNDKPPEPLNITVRRDMDVELVHFAPHGSADDTRSTTLSRDTVRSGVRSGSEEWIFDPKSQENRIEGGYAV
ncbi:hypothetical protein K432DRAFT_380360 [Lepidopterella palustris CBS 459.81]|uniref:Rhodopsin domain-containing protein n=1 Tax=Lepidopterella palustris CBS 459.81 TaxID=1314670 RepID=A0A8E2EEH6_9PEZI|nr:hypothetical protein K432DRAFT_380360 [Lepidopterella palustris CBS 459.81]